MRAELIRDVHTVLASKHFFTDGDFVVTVDRSKYGGGELRVVYYHDHKYSFVANIPDERKAVKRNDYEIEDYVISLSMAPGEITDKENRRVIGRSDLIDAVRKWADYLESELRASPHARQLQAQEAQLQKLMAELKTAPDDYFSMEQAETLRGRLDQLERDLTAKINEHGGTEKELRHKVQQLHAEFEALRVQVESLKVRNWFGAFMMRVGRWTRDPANRQLLKGGYETAKNLLPEVLGSGGSDGKG